MTTMPSNPRASATTQEIRTFLQDVKVAGPDAAQERSKRALESITSTLVDAPQTTATASVRMVVHMIDPDVWAARAELALKEASDGMLDHVERLQALNSSGGLTKEGEHERQRLEAAIGLATCVLIEAAERALSLADSLESLAAMLPGAIKSGATDEIQEKTAQVMRLLFTVPPVHERVLSLLNQMRG